LYIVPVCYFVFLCISFVCLSVCAAIWRNKGLYIKVIIIFAVVVVVVENTGDADMGTETESMVPK